MGAGAAGMLLNQFRERGVEYRVGPDRRASSGPKRQLTPEQKAELVARLAKARAAKQAAREAKAAA
jgi:hypothetical protein